MLEPAGPSSRSARKLPSLTLRLLDVSRVSAAMTIAVGALVLGGYALNQPRAIQLAPSLPPMYPITAIAFVAGGVAALQIRREGTRARTVGIVSAGLLLGIGSLDLLLHAIKAGPMGWFDLWPEGINVTATTPIPGRPVAEAGLALTLAGAASLAYFLHRFRRVAQGLAIGTTMIGLSAILGYIVGVDRRSLGTSLVAVGMALHTAIGVTTLGVAILLSDPGRGALRAVTAAGPYGSFGRRLVFATLVTPLVLAVGGVLVLKGVDNQELAISMLAAVQVVALSLLVLIPIDALERQQSEADRVHELTQRNVESVESATVLEESLAARLNLSAPRIAGWRIAVSHEPAHGHLTGDSCQILERDDHHVMIAILDVVGHGAPAGIQALTLRTQIETLWARNESLVTIADFADRTVAADGSMVSGLFVDIDCRTGAAEWVNAGHCPGVHLHDGVVGLLEPTGAVFGVVHRPHVTRSLHLASGDVLTVYTDGLTEAMDPDRRPFGDDRALRLITSLAHDGPATLTAACVDAAREHSGQRLRDDVLVLCLQRE